MSANCSFAWTVSTIWKRTHFLSERTWSHCYFYYICAFTRSLETPFVCHQRLLCLIASFFVLFESLLIDSEFILSLSGLYRMSFHICASRSSQTLLVFGVLFLVLPVLCHESDTRKFNIDSVIMEPLDGLRQYVESIVGTHVIQMGVEFVEMLVKFVAEGAASGLNVIAVYVSEILRATGVSDETISIPHFTTEGVYSVIKWALLALIGYWILTVVLRITVALVRRVFWLLKAIIVLWVFIRIVNDPTASTNITTLRLTLLVLISAVFGVATSSAGGNGGGLEKRVRNLEGKLKVMDKTKTESDSGRMQKR